jgi:tetratricopeptide (TPR) repeat protein
MKESTAMRLSTRLIGLSVLLSFPFAAQADDLKDCAFGEPDQRISACSRLIEATDPGNRFLAVLYGGRGQAYVTKGLFDEALGDFNKATEIDPKLIVAYSGRGYVYFNKKQYDDAVSEITKAIEIEPDSIALYYLRVWIYESKGDLTKAATDRERIKALENKAGQQ